MPQRRSIAGRMARIADGLFQNRIATATVDFSRVLFVIAIVLSARVSCEAIEPSAEQLEFFEKQVRPLLAEHCHECHGSKKQEAGLRLDTQAGFLKGYDGGPIFIAGNVDGSLIMQVVNYPDAGTQMPPKGKLPEQQIGIIKQWLEMGAPWPAETSSIDSGLNLRNHWAFQPVTRPAIPSIADSASLPLSTPIDSFIAATLAEKQLVMSDPASRETFIRRATLDLWGIPPTYEAVREFADQTPPDAAERLIDQLLASPLYGQRWGRHWLDLARYADSKGYVFTAEPRYPYSYTYRDYVIDAFNADKPFDQFVTEQLAADMIADPPRKGEDQAETHDPRLAALGFLTVGRRYLNNAHDIIDDRIDVVSRGLLGLTVGCARCHDHKFDPIPTADYYSLYGIFSSTTEPENLPIIGAPKSAEAHRAFLAELANREEAITKFEIESLPKLADEIRDAAGDALQMIARQIPAWAQTPLALHGKNEPRPPVVQRWKDYLTQTAQKPNAVWAVWHQLSKIDKPEQFPAEVTKLIESWSNPEESAKVNERLRQAVTEQKPATLLDLARLYGTLFRDAKSQWLEFQKATPDGKQLPDEMAEQLRQPLYSDASPAAVGLEEGKKIFARDIQNKVTNLKRQADNLRVMSPGAPPRAMIVQDGPVHEPVIFVRGNPGRHGKQVPRQFLEAASESERKPFTNGSGRLELATAIISSQNPLTARVFVNRIWQHHFGTGIVATPSDFGVRGMAPTHPQLLDWLAAEMSEIGRDDASQIPLRWSIKRIHRLILTSAVAQQSSAENPAARAIDPENRLLWRMPRQRLDFESFRDSLLAASGKLDDSIGGQPFDGVMNPSTARRTVYTLINRNDLPGIFRSFDYADTDSSAPERPQTTVPQQALFAMNSPFVQEQARHLAATCQAAASDDSSRIDTLFRRVFSRNPTESERQRAIQFLTSATATPDEKLSPWDRLTQVLLITNEFVFVD